jgi:MFS family permease
MGQRQRLLYGVHEVPPAVHRVAACPEVAKLPSETRAPRAGWGFISIYAAAYAGTWLALLTPIMVTLALRVRELAPGNASGQLSLVLSVGALFALLGNPLFGRLSDRTTSRRGMRRPWLIGGALAGAASLWLVAVAPSMSWVLIGWCLTQLSFNAVLAPLAALLPDQVPPARRGTVAGIISICTPVGQVGGTYLTHAVAGSMIAMFLVPAAAGVAAIVLLALVLQDRCIDRAAVPAARWAHIVRSFWISPQRFPDFAWIWAGRFFLMMAMAFLLAYQPYYLMNRLGFASAAVPDLIFRSTLVCSASVIVAGLASGRLSDLTGRRKPFVIGAALLYALGAGTIAAVGTYPLFLVGMAIAGIGLGTYLSVDFALVTDALPNEEKDAAKDLGVFNIASTLPQSIAPVLASVILAFSGGNYSAVFAAAGLVALLSAAAIVPVKRVS